MNTASASSRADDQRARQHQDHERQVEDAQRERNRVRKEMGSEAPCERHPPPELE